MNVDRLLCGIAAPIGEDAFDDRSPWTREELQPLADADMAIPLMWAHNSVMVPVEQRYGNRVGLVQRPIRHIGSAFRFAIVDEGPCPAGLLALAELDEGAWCDAILADVRLSMAAFADRQVTGLSMGFDDSGQSPELSLCSRPAFDSARVIGVGASALSAWGLLTGEVVGGEPDLTPGGHR